MSIFVGVLEGACGFDFIGIFGEVRTRGVGLAVTVVDGVVDNEGVLLDVDNVTVEWTVVIGLYVVVDSVVEYVTVDDVIVDVDGVSLVADGVVGNFVVDGLIVVVDDVIVVVGGDRIVFDGVTVNGVAEVIE